MWSNTQYNILNYNLWEFLIWWVLSLSSYYQFKSSFWFFSYCDIIIFKRSPSFTVQNYLWPYVSLPLDQASHRILPILSSELYIYICIIILYIYIYNSIHFSTATSKFQVLIHITTPFNFPSQLHPPSLPHTPFTSAE